ncbi:universal stress protein [Kribbella solani]|uniref:universal stress protein n=1 Tax=Kribbella solani TaxID=236067 RepID=UPI00299FA0D7|nr:universal stress protein [Kribbella solani]MDX3005050.1 universal stress protein [Kribbella solani]
MSKAVIHVGVDDSWRDTGAMEWALQESLLRREPLQAVHVIDERIRTVAGIPPDLVDDQATELVNTVQGYLDEHRNEAQGPGLGEGLDASPDDGQGLLDHEAELMLGPPARTLTDAAADSRMLVVGRRGMGTFKRLLIGSTSEAVVDQTTVPVVIVPDRWKPSDHAGPVVVALDQGDDHAPVMEFAIAAASERNVPVRIVYVFDLPGLYGWEAVNAEGVSVGMREQAERHFENVAAEWNQKYPDVTIEVDVRRGHRVDGVLNGAAKADAQLIVVGAHHHARVTAALLGTVTRGVLHHATCPLAVVPV